MLNLMLKMKIFIFILYFLISYVNSSTYSPSTYPNPTKANGFKECNMKSISNICDPDEVLSFSDRYRLDYELRKMNERTAGSSGSHCSISGVKAVLVIASDVNQNFADQLNKNWNLDGQCKKSVIFVLDSGTNRLYYSTESDSGVDTAQFLAIIAGNQNLLRSGDYAKGLQNIFKQIGGETGTFTSSQSTTSKPKSLSSSSSSIKNALVPPGSKREKVLNTLGTIWNVINKNNG
ncbi:TPM domain-containing protein [Strongyloides ratti]|uniref:TPM domain-containing protein n=1 Tax=Strongyloides ratti TaxID=34506 RepID=A0A090L7P6_STRRB|nr:TPM domain-containing protein [Strongyloides ratti]CEF63549.1 TPM domain-containing protein [Strongyloides ratti]